MAQRQLSRTLPKNFTFPSLSAEGPRTPERELEQLEVPPPPRQSTSSVRLPRVRARAGTDVCERIDLDLFRFRGARASPDVPVPSIEFPSRDHSPLDAADAGYLTNDDRYLAPPRQRVIFKTPPSQIRGTTADPSDAEQMWPSWDATPGMVRGFVRPGSSCSDSSCESVETFASRPSVGGSCTSMESDHLEYYYPKDADRESPCLPQRLPSERTSGKDKSWTREMDNHLWNTYQLYLQDPTITPFKQTPGTIPPLGVTARVARRARRTWDTRRLAFPQPPSDRPEEPSGMSTPKAQESFPQPTWPRSDTKTRSRLKLLCRRRFSISPHYYRIMQSRTPEPIPQTSDVPSEPTRLLDRDGNSYATRDLGVSLVSTHNAVLAGFAENQPRAELRSDWFNNAMEPAVQQAHPAARPVPEPPRQSYPFPAMDAQHLPPRLGSPFMYNTWGPGGSGGQSGHVPRAPRRDTVHMPPVVRDDSLVWTRVLSNRTMALDEDDTEVQNRLEHFIRENELQSMGKGRVRIRNRGATTSSAVPPREVDQLFSPPSSAISSLAEETTPVSKPPVNSRLNIDGVNIKRLGSPFKLESALRQHGAPKRVGRHTPSLSEPFVNYSPFNPPIGPSFNLTPHPELDKIAAPPFPSPFEVGLPDAERIRRQILMRK
ncbi:hypothetical protein N7539_004350 [Penicillium diatomitis]|uniref:Uncharacterized protein n=1 Tax=Penicillium diatomitis TaxID=2819901 RepID=A0A9X0BY61_9EURO|nr:uncharacterized protein N7539_004350 [Penicillium diatomitis]KAJ5489460.1 hypothetical protein N7539_004350 [Penicillium diatomitis]